MMAKTENGTYFSLNRFNKNSNRSNEFFFLQNLKKKLTLTRQHKNSLNEHTNNSATQGSAL